VNWIGGEDLGRRLNIQKKVRHKEADETNAPELLMINPEFLTVS